MQTITTKTNHDATRLKATHTESFTSVKINYDYNMSLEENHTKVALILARKLHWKDKYVGGHTKKGMVFVNTKSEYCFGWQAWKDEKGEPVTGWRIIFPYNR